MFKDGIISALNHIRQAIIPSINYPKAIKKTILHYDAVEFLSTIIPVRVGATNPGIVAIVLETA